MERIDELKYSIKSLIGGFLRPIIYIDYDVPIFMFHRVVETITDDILDTNICISKDNFLKILNIIKTHFRIISLNDLFGWKIDKESCCVITFDDGWIDNFEIAFPILRDNRINATIFLPTGMIGTNNSFWFEQLQTIINWIGRDRCRLDKFEAYLKYNNLISDDNCYNMLTLYNALVVNLKRLHPSNIEVIVNDIGQEFIGSQSIFDKRTLLNWNEIEIMSNDGISFGSHCVNHSILTNLTAMEKRYEIFESKSDLLKKNINYVNCISFPNGNYDQQSLDVAEEAKYDLIFSASINKNGDGNSPLLSKRIGISDNTVCCRNLFYYNLFKAKLNGGFYRIKKA
jgi:peptidoglycan/xylan/chitin deacetylase (PgdA/CDA1 family)